LLLEYGGGSSFAHFPLLIESSKTNSQKNNEIKRKADKISKIQRTFPLVIFWTIIQTAVPKNIRTATRTMIIKKSLVFHFISAWQPVSGRKSK
jgi:hypothetical protein